MHDTMSFRNDCTCLPVCSLFFFALTVPAFEMQSQQIRVVSNIAPVFKLTQFWTCWNEAWASELRERLSSVTRGGTWWMKLKTRERAATVMCVTFSVEITTLGLINNREGRVGAKSCTGWTGEWLRVLGKRWAGGHSTAADQQCFRNRHSGDQLAEEATVWWLK